MAPSTACGQLSIDGREDEYRWAGPYMVSRQVVAVMPGSDIETLADLAGKTVAVQATTKPEALFLDGGDPRIPEVRALLSMQKRELIYAYLSKGYADAVAAHETSICSSCRISASSTASWTSLCRWWGWAWPLP